MLARRGARSLITLPAVTGLVRSPGLPSRVPAMPYRLAVPTRSLIARPALRSPLRARAGGGVRRCATAAALALAAGCGGGSSVVPSEIRRSVDRIAATPGRISVYVGDSATFTAKRDAPDGAPTARAITLGVTNPGVVRAALPGNVATAADTSAGGGVQVRVYGLAPGSAWVQVVGAPGTGDAAPDSVAVVVEPAPPDVLAASSPTLTLTASDSTVLVVTRRGATGTPSLAPVVVRVAAEGAGIVAVAPSAGDQPRADTAGRTPFTVRALAAGRTWVLLQPAPGTAPARPDSVEVTVRPQDRITAVPSRLTLAVGDSAVITGRRLTADSTPSAYGIMPSAAGEAVTVAPWGRGAPGETPVQVWARAVGTAWIRMVAAPRTPPAPPDSLLVTVAAPTRRITLAADTLAVDVGGTQTIAWRVTDQAGRTVRDALVTARVVPLRAGAPACCAVVVREEALDVRAVAPEGALVIVAVRTPVGVPEAATMAAEDTLQVTVRSPATARVGWYVSPDGTVGGDGSVERPWSLAAALAQPSAVRPGDTIWVRGGRYVGDVASRLAGTPASPIVVRAYPGERATIDGQLAIAGSFTTYWGLEVTYSDPRRVSAVPGSDPPDVPREGKGILVTGPSIRLVHLTVHELGDGLFAGASAPGLEIIGCLFYNNGWQGPDRGHGHNIYLQNSGATKRVVDNVLFSSFAYGIQLYGSSAASVQDFELTGNTVFLSGAPVSPRFWYTPNIVMYGGGPGTLGRLVLTGNSLYHVSTQATSLVLGQGNEGTGRDALVAGNLVQGFTTLANWVNMTVRDNEFMSGPVPLDGSDALLGVRFDTDAQVPTWRFTGNRYAVVPSPREPFYVVRAPADGEVYPFADWQRTFGFDPDGTFLATGGSATGSATRVVVRPSSFEAGRAFVTVWNWAGAGSVPVDLSGVLRMGQRFTVHHVYDVFGPPLLAGTYGGGSVSVPQPTSPPPAPLGWTGSLPPADGRLNVFLVRSADAASATRVGATARTRGPAPR